MKFRCLLAVIALLSCVCLAEKIQASDWKAGTLIEQRSEDGSNVAGTNGNVQTYHYTNTYYKIDGGDMIYVAVRNIHLRWDKLLKLTVNAPIKYCVKGDSVYVLDEEGKEHKLSLDQKILKQTPK
jgi:uncharacterized protein YxeA